MTIFQNPAFFSGCFQAYPDFGLLTSHLAKYRTPDVVAALAQTMGPTVVMRALYRIESGGDDVVGQAFNSFFWKNSGQRESPAVISPPLNPAALMVMGPGGTSGRRETGRPIPIRLFRPDDYPAISQVQTLAYPDYSLTPDEMRFYDMTYDPRCRFQRWVVQESGNVIAFGEYSQSASPYHPEKFKIKIAVDPAHEGRGIGTALYNQIMNALQGLEQLSVTALIRDDMNRGDRFLKDRGFYESVHMQESRIDVTTFDPGPFQERLRQVAAMGIEIRTMKDLAGGPQIYRELYELEHELLFDAPSADGKMEWNYEMFLRRIMNDPGFLSDGYFIALRDGQFVGSCDLLRRGVNQDLFIHLTGVKRRHRGSGIAHALKLRAIDYARDRGHSVIRTWNEIDNKEILSINRRLGFVPGNRYITFARESQ